MTTKRKRIKLTEIFKMNIEQKKMFIYGIFITLILLSNILGSKISEINLFSFSVVFPVFLFLVPFTFVILNSVTEIYGKKEAQRFVSFGLFSIFLSVLIIYLFIYFAPTDDFKYNEEYRQIFGLSLRISFASFISFFTSELMNIFIFHRISIIIKNKRLWFRNLTSSLISELVDTSIFIFLAFYELDQDSFAFLLKLILPWWILRAVSSLIFTPFVYFLVKWLKKNDFESLY